jgi:uncharacterized protein YndB with AHSA1/START domain
MMAEIRHRVGVHAPIEEVYEAVSAATGIARWWTVDVEDDGDEVGVLFGGPRAATMQLAEHTPPTRMVWRFVQGPDEWVGTTATFDLRFDGDETVVCSLTPAGPSRSSSSITARPGGRTS